MIINFAHARESAHAAQAHKKLSNGTDADFTLTDCLMAAYISASVMFYPALVWFFFNN
jgi:hypothetical protein